MNIDNELIKYSIISSMTDEEGKRDYIDIFCVFVLQIVPQDSYVNVNFIQNGLIHKYNFRDGIPIATIQTILKRAKKNGYITTENREVFDKIGTSNTILYKLSEKGKEYIKHIESEATIKNKIDQLAKDIILYWHNRNIILDVQDIKVLLIAFIQKNINTLSTIILKNDDISDDIISKDHKNVRFIIDYLNFAKTNNPDLYLIFSNMVHASVISLALYSENIDEFSKHKIQPCIIYLDSNFSFSLLELHVKEECIAAKYLYNLLKREGFTFKIFDITLNEMKTVLHRFAWYLNNQHQYPPENMKTTRFGLYYTLKKQGWKLERVNDYTDNLENILKKLNVTIETILPNIKNDCLLSMNINKPTFESCTPSRFDRSREHDLIAIEMIKYKRKHRPRRLEKSIALFLSSDTTLSRFNYRYYGHREDSSICEVILDKFLLNIMWLKNPHVKVPLEAIIALLSRDLFVNKCVWDKFYGTIENMLEDKQINEDDIIQLFYNNYIEDVLGQIDEKDFHTVTEEFVKSNIKKAKDIAKRNSVEYEKAKNKLENELDNLREQLSKQETDKNIMILNIIEKDNQKLSILCNKIDNMAYEQSNKSMYLIFSIINIIVIFISILTFYLYKINNHFIYTIIIVIFLNLWMFLMKYPWSNIRNILYKSKKSSIEEKLAIDGKVETIKEIML